MHRVVPSPTARTDLEEIREYSLETFGPEVADAYFLGFDAVFDRLAEHPFIGASRPELGRGVRSTHHNRHSIFYEVDGEVVLILRIFHHARDMKRSLLE